MTHTKTENFSPKPSVPRIPQGGSFSEPQTSETVPEARAELSETCLSSWDSRKPRALPGREARLSAPRPPDILWG